MAKSNSDYLLRLLQFCHTRWQLATDPSAEQRWFAGMENCLRQQRLQVARVSLHRNWN